MTWPPTASSTTSRPTACVPKPSENHGESSRRIGILACPQTQPPTPHLHPHTSTIMKTSQYTSSLILLALLAAAATAADPIKASPEKEKEALAVLQSDAPAADKALACKKLALD